MNPNTAVYDNHDEFQFTSSNGHLNELRHCEKLTKFTLFKEKEGEYYRFLPWMRCTEYMNDFLHYTLYPDLSSTRGIFGFSKGAHKQYDPTFESIAIGFGDFFYPPMDNYDPQVSINLIKLLFDMDISVEIHPSGFVSDSIGTPSGTLYWNLLKVSPNLWECVPAVSLFFKSLRYHEWGLSDEAVAFLADEAKELPANDIFNTHEMFCQDRGMLASFKNRGYADIKASIDRYKKKNKENPGMFKGGKSMCPDSVHSHGIQTAIYKATY